ncbi:sulfur carrier protein ThiS [Streptomyces sp. NPDC088251]|uniref:sulfur carrier protein ThiS n=1 Tax=unclassified Streptomyces TaxID=2593676 RepID=UPI0033F9A24C
MTEPAPLSEPGSPSPSPSPPPSPSPSPAESAPLSVSVNGEVRLLPAGTTLDVLVATLTAAHSGVAAAVNETVVPRGRWSTAALGDGDRVEVLTAVQGG